MLTHDIKNPLAVVLGFTGLLGEIGELNEEQRDLVARMEANANAVLALVANYLDLAQIESGNLRLNKTALDVADLIDTLVAQYRGQAERHGIALTCETEAAPGIVAADPAALERVLTNLLLNAITFTPSGGRVTISGRRDGGTLVLRVSDTGAGIAPDELPSVFRPYQRGTARQPREGIGLGLFIAQSLIEAHGGHIEAASAPGQGSVFTIRLPIGSAPEANAASTA
jgi:two-component system sensor histidine kinase BaeS